MHGLIPVIGLGYSSEIRNFPDFRPLWRLDVRHPVVGESGSVHCSHIDGAL